MAKKIPSYFSTKEREVTEDGSIFVAKSNHDSRRLLLNNNHGLKLAKLDRDRNLKWSRFI